MTSTIGVLAVFPTRLLHASAQFHRVAGLTGALLIAAGILISFAGTMIIFRTYSRQRKALWQSGAQGKAQVRTIKSTVSKDRANCVLDVWVMPVDGAPAFEAILTTTAPKYSQPRVGDLVDVRYDPTNPATIIADQYQGLT